MNNNRIVWITADWDRHCHLWAGGKEPPVWDPEQGRWDDWEGSNLLRVRIQEPLAFMLAMRRLVNPGEIITLNLEQLNIEKKDI